MSLVVNHRDSIAGPGVDVLIAGVSHYPHLPDGGGSPAPDALLMQQLSSTALSAYRLYTWLVAHADTLTRPLRTVRLLLSPSPAEIAAEPAIASAADTCTFDRLRAEAGEWRADVAASRDGVALFYFAGHGVQRSKGDAVLLCEDFGDGVGGTLERAFVTTQLYNGMAPSPSRPDIARTQLYFIDACRMPAASFARYETLTTGTLWDLELAGRDDRVAPIFYATVPGALAYARKGKRTLFNEALLDCLDGAAADAVDEDGVERWYVSYHTLASALASRLKAAGGGSVDQVYRTDGFGDDAVINYLQGPPTVPIELELEPRDAVPYARVEILDENNQLVAVPTPIHPHPYCCNLPAGVYTISARFSPPHAPFVDRPGKPRPYKPPAARWVRSVVG